jgi:hypothetical protein
MTQLLTHTTHLLTPPINTRTSTKVPSPISFRISSRNVRVSVRGEGGGDVWGVTSLSLSLCGLWIGCCVCVCVCCVCVLCFVLVFVFWCFVTLALFVALYTVLLVDTDRHFAHTHHLREQQQQLRLGPRQQRKNQKPRQKCPICHLPSGIYHVLAHKTPECIAISYEAFACILRWLRDPPCITQAT